MRLLYNHCIYYFNYIFYYIVVTFITVITTIYCYFYDYTSS